MKSATVKVLIYDGKGGAFETTHHNCIEIINTLTPVGTAMTIVFSNGSRIAYKPNEARWTWMSQAIKITKSIDHQPYRDGKPLAGRD